MDSLKLFQMALAQGISIAPGPIFSPAQRFRNCIRLNYGSPWTEECEKAMETLGRIVRSF
jgi:DNA-binding transcriptional MocR family regulator